MTRPRPRPTLQEVARAAGVSITTASRVLRGDPHVAAATRTRVQQVADHLGMRPNTLAQSLRASGTSPLIGVILPDVADPFFAQLAHGIETEMTNHSRSIVLACHQDNAERCDQLIAEMSAHRLQALIVVPAPGVLVDPLAAEVALGTAVVIVDRPVDGLDADTVIADNRRGMHELVDAVLADGHRRIALLTLDERIWTQSERREVFLAALAAHGIENPPVHALARPREQAEGIVAAMLREPEPPTAIISAAVPPLLGALRAVSLAGAQVQLACVDDNEFFSLLPEPIIAVRQDPLRIGAIASGLVLERLEGLDEPGRRVVLPISAPRRYGLTRAAAGGGKVAR